MGLKTLTLMQLKDKIDMSYMKKVKSAIYKIVMSVLKFGVITALIYLSFYFLDFLNLVSLLPGIPINLFIVIFTIMMLLSILVCTYGLMKILYFGKDNQLLLTLPVDKKIVFTSKILVYYFYELIRNIYYLLPLLLSYGLINKLPISFWLWLIPAYLVVTATPVIIGSLLSIPAMLLTIVIKNNKWLQYPLIIISVSVIVLGLVSLIMVIPENFDLFGSWGTTFWSIQAFLASFVKIFIPFTWLAEFIVGNRFGIQNVMFTSTQLWVIFGLIGTLTLIMLLTYFIAQPIYFKMASVPFEFKKTIAKRKIKDKQKAPGLSIVIKETKMLFRDSGKLFALLAIAIAMPMSILLLNKIFAAMDTQITGLNMAVAFNVLLILLIALSSNARLSYIYSEEGESSYLNKTSPQTYLKLLSSKLIVNFVVISISILVTVIIMSEFQDYSFIDGIQVFAFIELLYVAHMLLSAELDVMNPQTSHYKTTGGHTNNPNETKSTIIGFLVSTLAALITFFFMSENYHIAWSKLLIFAGIFFVIRLWLYVNKVKVFYGEKVG